ncbi:MAG: hypothetical protein QGG69_08215, partial [Kiritimatiellia bacterium]|nr:hypothetical protein [Kiritimatiellia bacterium]
MSPSEEHDFSRVASARRMAGHTLWNLVGMGVPMLAGAIAFPIMLSERIGLGKERLEVLGLVWMLVGFSSIFDLGLGRALTKLSAMVDPEVRDAVDVRLGVADDDLLEALQQAGAERRTVEIDYYS